MRLRLATFNVESLDDVPGHLPTLDVRIKALRPQLARLDADVLCLQEVNGQDSSALGLRRLAALDELLRATPYADFDRAFTTTRHGHIADVHNLVILSRWPLARLRQYWNDLVPPIAYVPATALGEPLNTSIAWDRPVLSAVVTVGSRPPLHLFNLHLRAPLAVPIAGRKLPSIGWQKSGAWAEGYFIAAIKRSGQALEARLAVDRILEDDRDAYIAVAGDCNATLEEMPLRILCGAADDIGNPGLESARLHSLTEHIEADCRYTTLHNARKRLVDHILASSRLAQRCRAVVVDNGGLLDEVRDESQFPISGASFHAPVVAEFDLPN
ncbi:MAG: endonuclease/exonuclease/phosphatase family protein [Proteobacteria bacterium]|nr:endonuclease/exonuclease/phosphatase family protein [Pseudomonadota bacterium]